MLACPECGEKRALHVERYVDESGHPRVQVTCNVIAHEAPVVTDLPDPGTSTDGPIALEHRTLLVRLTEQFRPGMSPSALYDATRQWWRLGPRRELVDYAFAVNAGVVRACYRVDGWREATDAAPGTVPRWGFWGRSDEEMEQRYVGADVTAYFPRGAQTPVRYVNVPEL